MKPLLIRSMGILCLIFSFQIFAQAQEKGKLAVNVSIDINASAAEVWNILGTQFAEIEKWSSAITSSEEVPYSQVPSHIVAMSNSLVAGRKTKSKTIDATEIIVEYSDAKKALTFVNAETPSFLVYAINYTQVSTLAANQSRVTFDIELQLKGLPIIFKSVFKKKMTKAMTQLQQDLKQYVEANL
ncbi:MAG: SRPBCC family protein [Bacteroidia bacterium]